MKFLRIIASLIILGTLLTSCGGDDCTQADWVGTYSATKECDTEFTPAEIIITASGDESILINIIFDNGSSIAQLSPFVIDNCSVSKFDTEDPTLLSIDATLENDGNTLMLATVFVFAESTMNCSTIATRI